MMMFLTIFTAMLLIIGSFFCLIASIGIIRFPDIYSRMHAASKAGAVGSGIMLLAAALLAEDVATSTRAIAGVIFLLLTAPISAHLLAKAAYQVGYRMWDKAVLDEMGEPNGPSQQK